MLINACCHSIIVVVLTICMFMGAYGSIQLNWILLGFPRAFSMNALASPECKLRNEPSKTTGRSCLISCCF